MIGHKIAEIWETQDYQAFKNLRGNRDVTANRAKKIRDSIVKNGWILNPINVNENLEIIDGQGRFEALRTLGLPVPYYVNVGAGEVECVALNASNTSWTINDYIKLYAEAGNDNYIRYKALIDEFGEYGLNAISFAIGGAVMPNAAMVKSGSLKCTAEQYVNARDMLGQLNRFSDLLKVSKGKRTFLAAAILFALGCDGIDPTKLAERLKYKIDEMPPVSKMDQTLVFLSDVYNYRSRDEKVYLHVEYDKFLNGKYGWYAKKWGKAQ